MCPWLEVAANRSEFSPALPLSLVNFRLVLCYTLYRHLALRPSFCFLHTSVHTCVYAYVASFRTLYGHLLTGIWSRLPGPNPRAPLWITASPIYRHRYETNAKMNWTSWATDQLGMAAEKRYNDALGKRELRAVPSSSTHMCKYIYSPQIHVSWTIVRFLCNVSSYIRQISFKVHAIVRRITENFQGILSRVHICYRTSLCYRDLLPI